MGVLNMFPFDPAGLNSEANAVKEIKNGRLAMVRLADALLRACGLAQVLSTRLPRWPLSALQSRHSSRGKGRSRT